MSLKDTYANVSSRVHRVRAAATLFGVSDTTMRTYVDQSGIEVRRASDENPDAPPVRVFDVESLFAIADWRRSAGLAKVPPGKGKRPIVISVDVIKGGTGKSTTTGELGFHLQLMGYKCLLIDLDVQANLTQMYGYEADFEESEAEQYGLSQQAIVTDTFASLVIPFIEGQRRGGSQSGPHHVNAIKKPFGEYGPSLIPADTFLGDMEQAVASSKGHRELIFSKMFAAALEGKIEGFDIAEYDVILFDCPPSISFCSTAALAASDIVIAPIKLDAFSTKGLTKLMSEMIALEEDYQLRPDLIILPTHYAPNLARMGRMQNKLSVYHEHISPFAISASEEFPKSLDEYLPLSLQKPTSPSSKEYRAFAEFVAQRIADIAGDK